MKFLILLISICILLSCQDKKVDIQLINPIPHEYKFSSEIEDTWSNSEEPWRFQAAGSEYSYIGKYKEVSDNFYKDIPNRPALDDSLFEVFNSKYKAVSAKDYIIKRAINEQIVIINEAHHKAKHRILTSSLLQDLYDLGFRYFGAETFSEIDQYDLTARKYPIYRSGVYSKEPQFGNLIREALRIGYEPFPYEGEGNGKPREINQAKNIQAFMNEHVDGKILIHCGYAHATEGELGNSWEKAMAGRLLDFTGVNPLTINQTKFDNKYDFDDLKPLQKRLTLTEPTVFVDENDLSYEGEENDNGFDILVFHEQNNYEDGRPDFLLSDNKEWVNVSLEDIKMKLPYFVFAFKAEENITESIPVDLVEVSDTIPTVKLAIAKGDYKIVVQNIEKKAVSFALEVN